jgi:hypothetical protein
MAVAVCLGVDGQVRSGEIFEMTVDAVGGVYIISETRGVDEHKQAERRDRWGYLRLIGGGISRR